MNNNRDKRILLVTQYFPPEVGAPQARLFELARTMVKKGWEVQVLTAMPNYPTGVIHDAYKGKWFMKEEMEGIQIFRTAIYPTKKAAFIPRLTNYFSFVISCVVLGFFRVRRPMAVIVESPPLFLGLSGIFFKIFKRTKLVMNISDLWPASMVHMGMLKGGWMLRCAEILEKLCYKMSDACTGQSKGIIRGVKKVHPGARVVHIPNGCDCDFFGADKGDESFLREHGLEGKTMIGYAGLIGLAQGVGIMLDMAERFRDREELMFVVVGDGPEREALEKRAAEQKLTNVKFTGSVPKSRMPGIVPLFDAVVIPLRYVIPGAVPSKIYESMASQTPIVLLAQGEPRELVVTAEAGLPADYDDPDAIAVAITRLIDNTEKREQMGRNGRDYVMDFHHRPRIAEKFMDALDQLREGTLICEIEREQQ